MAKEKLCPMLKEPCIREACMMWLKITISGTDKEGKTMTKNPPEQCAFVWAGLAGLKQMQFPGPGRPVPTRQAPGRPTPRS